MNSNKQEIYLRAAWKQLEADSAQITEFRDKTASFLSLLLLISFLQHSISFQQACPPVLFILRVCHVLAVNNMFLVRPHRPDTSQAQGMLPQDDSLFSAA